MKKNYAQIVLSLLILSCLSVDAQHFTDVSKDVGIDQVYLQRSGMGGGCVFFDFDNDGDEDLYASGGKQPDKFYENNGDGTFSDISASLGITALTENVITTGVATGDIDNDGDREIFVTTWSSATSLADYQPSLLLEFDGSKYVDIGVSAGIVETKLGMGVIFTDYNLDGFLDIYVQNYIDKVGFDVNNFPNHECFANDFYINNGDNTFTESAASLGLDNIGCGLAAMATDLDGDNDMDIYLANDFGEFILPNAFYRNNYPNDSFTDIGPDIGADIGLYGMGIACGDYDHDGDFDYYVTNVGRNVLLKNENDIFADYSTEAGVENTYTPSPPNAPDLLTTGWGAAFIDYDNNTVIDLMVSNGRVPTESYIPTGEIDPNILYVNQDDGTFLPLDNSGLDDGNRGRGMAYSDYDDDGDIDFFITVQDRGDNVIEDHVHSTLHRNNYNGGNNWIKFKLEGVSVNRDAYGARVYAWLNGKKTTREIYGGSSHASQHSSIIHVGLGASTALDSIRVIWPGGKEQLYDGDLSANQTVYIKEDTPQPPLQFVNFTAVALSDEIKLNWTTINESSDNTGFEILRSDSGNPMSVLVTVAPDASGNYEAYDDTVTKGVTYNYRIKQINTDGSFTQTNIRSVLIPEPPQPPVPPTPTTYVGIYPNPVTDVVNMQVPQGETIDAIYIYKANGKLVTVETSLQQDNGKVSLDVHSLPAGIYFVEINSAANTYSHKMVKVN